MIFNKIQKIQMKRPFCKQTGAVLFIFFCDKRQRLYATNIANLASGAKMERAYGILQVAVERVVVQGTRQVIVCYLGWSTYRVPDRNIPDAPIRIYVISVENTDREAEIRSENIL